LKTAKGTPKKITCSTEKNVAYDTIENKIRGMGKGRTHGMVKKVKQKKDPDPGSKNLRKYNQIK